MSVRKDLYKIGHVSAVDGSAITVEADKLIIRIDEKVEAHITVGSFINCGGDHGDVLCVVTRAWQELVDRVDPNDKKQRLLSNVKKVEMVVVGTIEGGFRRGVDQLPPVGSTAYFVTGDAFDALLDAALDEESKARLFPVGHRVGTGKGVARFDLDKFFGRHAAVLGTTGSGKSYTVAALAQAVLRSYARPRLVVFDIHNEYGPAFLGEFETRSSRLGWADFRLPFWMLTFEEFAEVFTGGKLGSVQRAVLAEHLLAVRRECNTNPLPADDPKISVDTPIPFLWDDLIQRIAAYVNGLGPSKQGSLPEMIDKMRGRRRDPRYAFLFHEADVPNAVASFFKVLFGLGLTESHVTVLDLSGLPAEVRATAIGILTRLFFDYRYWDAKAENLPIALVLEEAHSYIPADADARYAVAVEAIERVAKEGRKYGLSLVVVSQRPANVSPTILSQCGTFVALRLTSDIDQSGVLRLLPDTLGNQGSLLSSLRDGEAVVSGDGVTLPGRVRFEMPTPRPGSSDVRFHRAWTDGPPPEYTPEAVIKRWLNQDRG
jgi:DNA helicase HerA-like ATPase